MAPLRAKVSTENGELESRLESFLIARGATLSADPDVLLLDIHSGQAEVADGVAVVALVHELNAESRRRLNEIGPEGMAFLPLDEDELDRQLSRACQGSRRSESLGAGVGLRWEADPRTLCFTFIEDGAEQLLGYSPKEWSEPNFWVDRLHPDDRSWVVKFCTKTTALGQPHAFEYRLLHKDGHTVWVYDIVRVTMESGKPVLLDGWLIDVSPYKDAERERRQLEVQVHQQHKLESLGRLAGGIAHDFNNILQGVFGYTDLTLLKLQEEDPVRKYIEGIRGSAKRAAELCRQLLAYSGRARFATERVDVNELVRGMKNLLEVTVAATAKLELQLSSAAPAVEVDPTQLSQVIANLVVNASEALGNEPGLVCVATGVFEGVSKQGFEFFDSEGGDFGVIEVSDSGCGIEMENLGKIFDPFYTTKFTGRGLGLAAVYGIVRSHRGAIQVTSEPGEGTCVRVLLPLSMKAPTPARTVRLEAETWRGSGVVLVVDDEPLVREICEALLLDLGFEVLTASDGIEGVERFRDRHSSLTCVLLDMVMPRKNGVETLRELREVNAEVPVVFSSGFPESSVLDRLGDLRTEGFIKKPYERADLIRVLRELV